MKIPRREFLQLAETYSAPKHSIAGWYVSEKLDGTRCFWDGGLSRGVPTLEVPWASIFDPKTGKLKAKIKPVATGLWSRYGNPIMAPDWFLNSLPCCPLDGELHAGRGNFQLCRSICAGDEPDPRFNQISYAVYSSPPLPAVAASGQIKNANMLREIDLRDVEAWVKTRLSAVPDFCFCAPGASFDEEIVFLRGNIETQNDNVFLHQQVRLPEDEAEATKTLDAFMEKVLDRGGEGVVLRNPRSSWTPKRHRGILKCKPFNDAEAVITGFVAGRHGKTDQVLGKIGAIVVKTPGGIEFEIGTGLTMDDRALVHSDILAWACANPGERFPEWADRSKHFRVGQTITYLYRELSDDGVPKEARYHRIREGVE